MWWKFWTWGRKDLRQPEFGGDKAPNVQTKGAALHSPDSEDILGSISSLIGDLPSIDSERKARLASPLESVQSTETVETFLKVEPAKSSIAEQVPVADSMFPGAAPPAPTAINTPPAPKPVRETAPSKRKEARKDGRQTLVAGEGKWMDLKGMFDGSKGQDEPDDDDDPSGPSPYQTIVPSDD